MGFSFSVLFFFTERSVAFDELGIDISMVFCSFLSKRSCFFNRGLHLGKQFSCPNSEDIVFRAICVNLKHRRWKFLDQVFPSLTNALVSRVVGEFQNSPQLALEFYDWVGEKKGFPLSLT